MAILEAPERHQDLIDELIAEVAEYNPDVDRDLLARAFRFAAKAHAGQ
jgi:(p)ppGpp synthase/HD superfamily hydrolase